MLLNKFGWFYARSLLSGRAGCAGYVWNFALSSWSCLLVKWVTETFLDFMSQLLMSHELSCSSCLMVRWVSGILLAFVSWLFMTGQVSSWSCLMVTWVTGIFLCVCLCLRISYVSEYCIYSVKSINNLCHGGWGVLIQNYTFLMCPALPHPGTSL